MPTRIQISHLIHQYKSLLVNFGRKSFAADVFRSKSIAFHDVTL